MSLTGLSWIWIWIQQCSKGLSCSDPLSCLNQPKKVAAKSFLLSFVSENGVWADWAWLDPAMLDRLELLRSDVLLESMEESRLEIILLGFADWYGSSNPHQAWITQIYCPIGFIGRKSPWNHPWSLVLGLSCSLVFAKHQHFRLGEFEQNVATEVICLWKLGLEQLDQCHCQPVVKLLLLLQKLDTTAWRLHFASCHKSTVLGPFLPSMNR